MATASAHCDFEASSISPLIRRTTVNPMPSHPNKRQGAEEPSIAATAVVAPKSEHRSCRLEGGDGQPPAEVANGFEENVSVGGGRPPVDERRPEADPAHPPGRADVDAAVCEGGASDLEVE